MKEFYFKNLTTEKPSTKVVIHLTGYGFENYKDQVEQFFKIFFEDYFLMKEKSIKAIMKGLLYFKNHYPENLFHNVKPFEVTTIHEMKKEDMSKERVIEDTTFRKLDKPFLLITVKSGVSYYRVNADESYSKVSGSLIGESTFAGLIRILARKKNVEDALEASAKGDNRNVDMCVKDIYGSGYKTIGLPGDVLASSMGRAQFLDQEEINPDDTCRSLLYIISLNVAQLGSLMA